MSLYGITSEIPAECSAIISGGARGVDTLARAAAQQLGLDFIEIKPNYEIFGNTAPLVRNDEIVRKADLVLAFWDMQSRGTAYVIKRCIQWDIPVKVIDIRAEQ